MDYNNIIITGNKLIRNKEYSKCMELYNNFVIKYPDNENIKHRIAKLEELIKLNNNITTLNNEFNYYKSLQMALKLVLNGIYGAFANSHFVLSNSVIANSITGSGRDIIHYIMMRIENFFYNKWHKNKKLLELLGTEYIATKDNKYYFLDKNYNVVDRPFLSFNTGDNTDILESRKIKIERLKPVNKQIKDFYILYEYFIHDFTNAKPLDDNVKFEDIVTKTGENIKIYSGKNQLIIYVDTDSVSPDTIINTNNGNFTIEKLFNDYITKYNTHISYSGNEYVNCDYKILNWSKDNQIYYAKVKKLIRHRVKKQKWEIKLKNGETLKITNDHSVVIFRDGEQLVVKPQDIDIQKDKILYINY